MAGRRESIRTEAQALAALLAAGVGVGLVWRLAGPLAVRHADTGEGIVAGDAMLAALGAVAGVITGVLLLRHPGPAAVRRTVVVIVGSVVASATSWAAGAVVGAGPLRALGTAFVWPVMTSSVVFVHSAVVSILVPRRSHLPRRSAAGERGGDGTREPHEVEG